MSSEQDAGGSESGSGHSSHHGDAHGGDHSSDTGTDGGAPKVSVSAKTGWVLAGTYLLGWVIVLVIFRYVYGYMRKKRSGGGKSEGWLGPNLEKEAYEKLLRDNVEDEEVLRKALLRRAMSDIKRLWKLQEEKDSIYSLMRNGAISESAWADFKRADQDTQLEIYDLQAEAETFKEGWSQQILREAAGLVVRERELMEYKKQRDKEEEDRVEGEKKAQRAKEHEERQIKEQTERARKLAQKFLNEENSRATAVASGSGSASSRK